MEDQTATVFFQACTQKWLTLFSRHRLHNVNNKQISFGFDFRDSQLLIDILTAHLDFMVPIDAEDRVWLYQLALERDRNSVLALRADVPPIGVKIAGRRRYLVSALMTGQQLQFQSLPGDGLAQRPWKPGELQHIRRAG